MPEITPDVSDSTRCLSVHWSLPVQCVLWRGHAENWHEGLHLETGNRLRYRRSMGTWATEEFHHGAWHELGIPAPVKAGDDQAAALERARTVAVALEQENARLQQVIGFLLTNPMQQMAIRAWTSDIDAMAGRVHITDLGNHRTEIKYEWLQDFLTAPGGAS